jgi:hypothetical protein
MSGRRRLAALAGAVAVTLTAASFAGAGWLSAASAGPQTVAAGSLGAPSAPSASVACVQNQSLSVGLTWPAAANATGYDVLRATASGGPYSLVGSSATAAYTDAAVSQLTTYYYVVVATRSAWASAASAQTPATTPRQSNCK